nr:chromosome segregation protein SMC [Clostridium massiliamazoniense]
MDSIKYMFLKSLEIRGFKSFADKTELKFNKGITAVVGPNGSGKSNVSDAVRWVLGEQSAKTLRGSKMEDVIFTGTEYRKPIGLAQVSLTLDNSEGELPIEFMDVKVTRRIFRSGESEYLINNSQCRLKDVVNLFMDTGIGKEGYSLIGQGKIEAILNGKAEDRRALLEEAAGIVKFKSRKIDAEKKLKNTAENLTRINDIIYTYEERLNPLEEEKEKAEKYLELINELRVKDISLIINNINSLKAEIENRNKEMEALNYDNNTAKNKLKEAREKVKSLKEDLENLENKNLEKQELYISKRDAISNSKAEINLLEERIKNYEVRLEENKVNIKNSKEKIKSLIEEKNKLEVEFAKKNLEYTDFKEKIVDGRENIAYLTSLNDKKELELKKINEENLAAIRLLNDLNNQKGISETNLLNLEDKLKDIKSKVSSLEGSLKVNVLTKANLAQKIDGLKIEKEEINNKQVNNSEELKKLYNDLKNKDSEVAKISASLNRLEANKEMLKRLENQYEGYNVSVKKIMSHIKSGSLKLNNSKPAVLGEVIRTKEGYETAIEVTLGSTISNIITEDEKIAKSIIEYLKEKKLGRATLLPLSIIKGNKLKISDNLKTIDGYLGIASELVEFNSKYENIVNYVLGRTIICRDIDSGLAFAKETSYKYKIVTLSGEVLNAGGAMTGGSIYQKNMGIISRKNQILTLEEDINLNKVNLEELQKQRIDINKDIEKLKVLEENLRKNIYDKDIEILNIENEIKRIEVEIVNIKTSSKSLENELKTSNNRVIEIREEINKIDKRIHDTNEKELGNKIAIEDLDKELKELKENLLKLKEEETVLRVKNAQLEEFVLNRSKELKRREIEITEIKTNMERLESSIEEANNSIKDSKSKITENNNFINREESNIIDLESKSKEYDLEKSKIKKNIEISEGHIEGLTLELAKKEEEFHKNEIVYTRQESEMKNLSVKLLEDYDTTYEEELKNYVPIESIEKHRNNINYLKSKINALGTVNVNAIEEFRDLSEKYRFITGEKEDLEKSREELLEIIEEMTSKMRVMFRQNFNILNKNFDETFKELFKGGSAKLILDETDELNGDIEIRVQPPGKKIQNINLMSGGEKVLSAIALLFGILKMKPTPFCILDEIEAALDDANVNRYADFLKAFSENIQFIVITHRKGTMEAADIMYGVTMEEKGISKIVSVDLNKN